MLGCSMSHQSKLSHRRRLQLPPRHLWSVLSNVTVARGLTTYLDPTIGISSTKWRLTVPSLPKGFNEIDFVAVAVILLITLVITILTMKLHSLS